jgi:tRNA threonylcarbamoyladenosine biosynthesis protein TsaB
MTWSLGIDTSSTELGVGLVCDGVAAGSTSLYLRHSHAEHIASSVELLLRGHAVATANVSSIGVAVGPGSFTGLRIGIAFVKGYCLQRTVPILPISSLESVARAWPSMYTELIVAFDARKGEVFWARFAAHNGVYVRRSPDTLGATEQLAESLTGTETIVVDTLANAKCGLVQDLGKTTNVIPVNRYAIQRGLSCAQMAANALPASEEWREAADVTPHYLSSTYIDKK